MSAVSAIGSETFTLAEGTNSDLDDAASTRVADGFPAISGPSQLPASGSILNEQAHAHIAIEAIPALPQGAGRQKPLATAIIVRLAVGAPRVLTMPPTLVLVFGCRWRARRCYRAGGAGYCLTGGAMAAGEPMGILVRQWERAGCSPARRARWWRGVASVAPRLNHAVRRGRIGSGSIAGGRASHRAQSVLQGRKYRGVFDDRRGVRWLMDWHTPFLAIETITLDKRVFSNIVQRKIEHRLTCWLLPPLWGSALFSDALHRGGEAGAGSNPSCGILWHRGRGGLTAG